MFGNKVFTLTFGCQSVNHTGMQKNGLMSNNGFNINQLKHIKDLYEKENYTCKLYNLHDEIHNLNLDDYKAYILVIRNGVKLFSEPDNIFNTLNELKWDTKYFDLRRNKVLNKQARYNLCFSNFNQQPDYQNKKGTIYNVSKFHYLDKLNTGLKTFGEEFSNLECEGNNYFNIKKCGIGYHGDSERKKIIGCRFGQSLDLNYWWYYQNKRLNNKITIPLHHGDIYIMDEKASGFDWKSKNKFTLRHATGSYKYIK